MRITFLRPSLGAAVIVASAGILTGGLALRPAFAVGGSATVGPFTVVHCTSGAPCQTYNNSGHAAGLQGINSNSTWGLGSGLTGTATGNGYGVLGQATTNNAIMGTSNSGVGVAGNSSSNAGVYGYSSTSSGVGAQSVSGHGLDAYSGSSSAIQAASGSGIPIVAISQSNSPAIDALGSTGDAIDASTSGSLGANISSSNGNGSVTAGTYIGIIGRAPAGVGQYPLVLTDTNYNNLMYVNGNGDLSIHGSYFQFAKTHRGNVATAYTSKVTSPTVEDNGTGHLVNGVAMVQLDPAFADTIDSTRAYHVMLTPNGETRGLFVASKSPTGFVVREVQGGRSSIDFDYHIYASELGQSGVRMTELTPGQAAAMMPKSATAAPRHPHIRLPVLHH